MHYHLDAKKDALKDWKNLILNNLQLLSIMEIKDKIKTMERALLQEDSP